MIGSFLQDLRALIGSHLAPGRKSLPGTGNGCFRIGRIRMGHLVNEFFGRGIDEVELLSSEALFPGSVDE
jgi:hypothetical protein